jgi:uncharacterized protein YndB with AHSA1/START domain
MLWSFAQAKLEHCSTIAKRKIEGEKTFENEDGKTKYTTRVCHWKVADRETHEKMGFHQGWSQCADQLETLVANL